MGSRKFEPNAYGMPDLSELQFGMKALSLAITAAVLVLQTPDIIKTM